MLKTGENGGWLTAVARWHTRYLLRQISRRHDRASELCVRKLIRSESHGVWLVGVQCVVHCLVPPFVIVTRRALGRLRLGTTHYTFTMPPFFHLIMQYVPHVIRIVATHAYALVRPILIEAGRDVLERAQGLLVGWAARCVSFTSLFDVADVL